MEDVIFHALLGKYAVSESVLREQAIRPALQRYLLPDAPRRAVEIKSLEDDIYNQILVLRRVDEEWATKPEPDLDIDTLHQSLLGAGNEASRLRTTEFVEDFDGNPPTPLTEILAKRKIINGLLRHVDTLAAASVEEKAAFLADLVSKIIAAHVFADGNGRVARMAVQYCVRRWGMQFVPIPKVRNASRWAKALQAGVAGNKSQLAFYLEHLLLGESVHEIEQLLFSHRPDDTSSNS